MSNYFIPAVYLPNQILFRILHGVLSTKSVSFKR